MIRSSALMIIWAEVRRPLISYFTLNDLVKYHVSDNLKHAILR